MNAPAAPASRASLVRDAGEDLIGAAGWAALLGRAPARGNERDLAGWAERMADLISPALADHLLGEAGPGAPQIDPKRAAKARLYNRFLLRRQIEAVRLVLRAGVPFVCIKGFAFAHQVYRRPEARIFGDVDLLLKQRDLPAVVALLAAAGFSALPIASRFGFISQASFLPIVSSDGQVALDLHVCPDAWPASRALSAEEVFGRARQFQADGMELLGPLSEHSFFLIVTNIAKDRFGPEGVRKVLDAAMLLRKSASFDWDLVERLARAGGYRRSLAALLRLMERLGVETGAPGPLGRSIGLLAAAEVEAVARLYRRAGVARLSLPAKLRREILLGPDLASVLRINARRLGGLVRPGSGVPEGLAERRARSGGGGTA